MAAGVCLFDRERISSLACSCVRWVSLCVFSPFLRLAEVSWMQLGAVRRKRQRVRACYAPGASQIFQQCCCVSMAGLVSDLGPDSTPEYALQPFPMLESSM